MKTDINKNNNSFKPSNFQSNSISGNGSSIENNIFSLDEILQISIGKSPSKFQNEPIILSHEEKLEIIKNHVHGILSTLGLDLNDESLKDTPMRVAKMYLNETFRGLNPANEPDATLFTNSFQYTQMLVEKDITIYSTCEHHLVPIYGRAHIAYFSSGKVIGLSKLNRIADYYARRPQVQERLTIQIADAIKKALDTDDVAVIIEANHLCVASRGIRDVNSSTTTSEYAGKFLNYDVRNEFLNYLRK